MPKQETNVNKVVAIAAFAAFLATFNETYMNVAFSPIMGDLGVTVSTVQWLATAYMLGAAIMVPISAFAYRSIPTKVLFLLSVALLIAGSAIGGVAQCFSVLLAGRFVQALGTGMLIPVGINMTLEVAPKEKLGTYMGLMGAMTTLGPSLSVILAGILLSFSSWHLLLWVFAALSLVLFISGALFLGNIARLTRPKLDAGSVVLIGLALVGILYGVSTLFSGAIVLAAASIAAGMVLLRSFVGRQHRLAEPLISMRPLSSRPFAFGVVVNMISLIVIFALNIVLPIYIQTAKHASSLSASLILFPAIMLSCVVAPISGKIYDRSGPKVLQPVGFVLISLFALLLAAFARSSSHFLLAALFVPVICGSALIIGPVQSFALSHLKPEDKAHGVTVLSTGFQIAGCIGSSLFTGVYFAVMTMRAGAASGEAAASDAALAAAAVLASIMALAGLVLTLHLTKRRSYIPCKNRKPDDGPLERPIEAAREECAR